MRCGVWYYALRRGTAAFLQHTTHMSLLFFKTVIRLPLALKNISISVEEMYRIGIQSLPLVTITTIFLGAETAIQGEYQLSGFVPLKFLGVIVCKGIINELGPVITALVVSGRIATAIAAEIGSMKASEQLDAMECLSLDSIRYLILPKLIACVIMLPVLTIWAELMAIGGSVVAVAIRGNVSIFTYVSSLRIFFNPADLLYGIAKTAAFGAIITICGAYFGYQARGGAEGVGIATTKAVVTAAVLILIFDFIVAAIIW